MKSSKRIAWQRGAWATYADITVELDRDIDDYEITEPKGIELVDPRWRSGVSFALSVLREKLPRTNSSVNVQVTITSFRGQPSDTTTTAVAYVTFHAIAQQLAPELVGDFRFDEETAEYVLKSPRMI